jgi:hypothetical protein
MQNLTPWWQESAETSKPHATGVGQTMLILIWIRSRSLDPFLVWLLAALLTLPATSSAESLHRQGAGPWSLTGLVGQWDDSQLVDMVTLRGGDWRSSYLRGVVLGYQLTDWWKDTVWELEGQLHKHSGLQSNWEANGAIVLLWTRFPWNEVVNTTASIGQGMSLATQRPEVERFGENNDTRELLHYLHLEMAISAPSWKHLSIVGRIHHRSGVFGLYGVSGGSNFLTTGLRYRF